jgi:histone H3/H4
MARTNQQQQRRRRQVGRGRSAAGVKKDDAQLKMSVGRVRRLGRRGGVPRMYKRACAVFPVALAAFVDAVMGDAVLYVEHRHGKTINVKDMDRALARHGRAIYA